jgi:hypothetical protein
MERAEDVGNVGSNVRPERTHARRRVERVALANLAHQFPVAQHVERLFRSRILIDTDQNRGGGSGSRVFAADKAWF